MRCKKLFGLIGFTLMAAWFLSADQAFCVICPPGQIGDVGTAGIFIARDPNSLTGPAGFGDNHYVRYNTLLPYRIDFENDATANAPAQQVDIANQLEENLDWDTFQVTEIAFGDHFIAVPPGNSNYETTVPMAYDGVPFEVYINVGIDLSTGVVSAHFYSQNPETGWPPPAHVGFLPPEDGSGRGMGQISYTINHVEDIAENTEIRNVALIVFDLGEQIYTNQVDPHDPNQGTDPEKEALVTIDKEKPASSINELPEGSTETFFISWSGSDSASGIAGYDIYTRENQEFEWQLWLERTPETSAEFSGAFGNTYEFYSVAIDNVGQREAKNPVPGARTTANVVADQDEDGHANDVDNCPTIANPDQADTDGDGFGDSCDDDDDNDGVADAADNCPLTGNANQADLDGDGFGDSCDDDDDNDGVDDATDNCPLTGNANQADLDGDGFGDSCDDDDDNDGVVDAADNCPLTGNADQADLDGDGFGDACDQDDDNDGVADGADNCPFINNPDQADLDGDGAGDTCDPDDDNDGVADGADNCPFINNPDQADTDSDGAGDNCDDDDDNDGVADAADNCPLTANPDQADLDGDGTGNSCDPDDDNDGVADAADNCPLAANPDQADLDGDGAGNSCDPDDDNDGVADTVDNCPLTENPDQADLDGDGSGDSCDDDDDNDTVADSDDNCPVDANSDQSDLDQDGLGDVCDPQTCGNNVKETIELCDDGNFVEGDGCSSQCILELVISLSKAEIEWDDQEMRYNGSIRLPLGVSTYDVMPQGTVNIEILDMVEVVSEQIPFTLKAVDDKKWEYLDGTASIEEFRINWEGTKFDYKGLIHIKSNHLGHDSTSIEIDRANLTGPFAIQIGDTTIQVDADDTVTTIPATLIVDYDDIDQEIEVDLPFALTADMTIIVSRPDHEDTHISVADYMTYSLGSFDLRTIFNTAGLTGQDTPTYLKLLITLGETGYPGQVIIDDGWKTNNDKEWKYEGQ